MTYGWWGGSRHFSRRSAMAANRSVESGGELFPEAISFFSTSEKCSGHSGTYKKERGRERDWVFSTEKRMPCWSEDNLNVMTARGEEDGVGGRGREESDDFSATVDFL